MKVKSAKHSRSKHRDSSPEQKMRNVYLNIMNIFLFLILVSTICLGVAFKPLTKEEQIEKMTKMNENVEPFRKNLTECARQVRASHIDVDNFLKRLPQSTLQGQCFVACILKRTGFIKNNKIEADVLIEANRAVYGEDNEVMSRLKSASAECLKAVSDVFEICEYASRFNDCMHMKMEHILDQRTMERRMEALGQMSSEPDSWSDDEDEIMQLLKDEL